MLFKRRSRQFFFRAITLTLLVAGFQIASGQAQDLSNGENDPIKLFERGQDAHAKNDYKAAIELYEAAIKLKPEFAEAEFQRAMALLATNRKEDAIQGFNRAVALRPDWQLAYAKFGTFLAFFGNTDREAEPILRHAIELDGKNEQVLIALAEVRRRAGDLNEALKLVRTATSLESATSSTWRKRSFVEIAAGDKMAALASIDRALSIESRDLGARYDRARLRLDVGDRDGAFADLHILEQAGEGRELSSALEFAQLYARAGKTDDALRLLDQLSEKDRKTPEVVAMRAEIANDNGSSVEERAALEQILQRDPRNPTLLARLGNAYRTVDPLKSQDYYYRALQIEPNNSRFATGYAAALVQLRRFAEAAGILRRVINKTPDDYPAHANLALALYELKDYAAALPEYEWLAAAHPEIAATYFFIATAHDKLGEYQQALDGYEKFLSHADPNINKLDIEKVNLRLPGLRAQIKRGEGRKKS